MTDCQSPTVTHIVGLDITLGDRYRRQRCAWCDAVLLDEDLSLIAVALNPDGSHPGPPAPWPVGGLVRVDGPAKCVIDNEKLPLTPSDFAESSGPDSGRSTDG